MKDYTVGAIILVVILTLLLLVGCSLLTGLVGYLLWNWLAVSLFGAPEVSFWTAWGICFAIGFIKNLIFPSHKTINFKD